MCCGVVKMLDWILSLLEPISVGVIVKIDTQRISVYAITSKEAA
ncbi:hypothetical protein XIS1_1050007 [Xenorhabdus innexi]|uniref:Transposase n=1 Tax=Xenorhabdus innexi TaxID=290109 RepID=A0A1N6MQH7_9GAMM|nr:hypothetical protein XIS1_1050007 [Xenorhabdus innexi]